MNIRFLEPAKNELDDAFDWYEMEQRGLGRRFLAEIQSALKRITVFPDSCAVIAPGLRRCMTRKVPYMLVYMFCHDATRYVLFQAGLRRGAVCCP